MCAARVLALFAGTLGHMYARGFVFVCSDGVLIAVSYKSAVCAAKNYRSQMGFSHFKFFSKCCLGNKALPACKHAHFEQNVLNLMFLAGIELVTCC